MTTLGRYAILPLSLGGGDETLRIEHEALLDALSPGWDTSYGTGIYEETFADALAVTMIWHINRRLANQAVPERMLEQLPRWEQATRTVPLPTDRDVDRRAAVAAKLRGYANNALGDIEAAAQKILGSHFHSLILVAPGAWITYWPGVNPGPPGLEWASNRARIAVRATKDGLSEAEFVALRDKLARHLDDMLPAWMGFCVGVGSAFIANIGIVGQTLL